MVNECKIVVISPGGYMSGGQRAMHQLVHMCNSLQPKSAAICYRNPFADIHNIFDGEYETPEIFLHYKCPVINGKNISDESLLVFPEIDMKYANCFNNRKAFWWLSLDSFFPYSTEQEKIDVVYKFDYHLFQSIYAYKNIAHQVKGKKLILSDWLDLPKTQNTERENMIALNPVKDVGFGATFVSENQDLQYLMMKDMTPEQLSLALKRCKIYIDFGNHPGKDRIPREAAISGCVVLSTKFGSASVFRDMPIHDWFKFTSIVEVRNKVDLILSNYDHYYAMQEPYRNLIQSEKDIFEYEVQVFLNSI